jgi:hypothetical protein
MGKKQIAEFRCVPTPDIGRGALMRSKQRKLLLKKISFKGWGQIVMVKLSFDDNVANSTFL